MFLQTFSPVLDGKVVSLAVLSVALFVSNSITVYLGKRELEKIRADVDTNARNIAEILTTFKKIMSDVATIMGYSAENNIHLKRSVEQIDDIKTQMIILASSHLKQTETHQRVMDSLIDAIGDHQR